MKTCYKCKEVKSKSEFNKDKSTKDGVQTQCKYCKKAYDTCNKERIVIYSKTYNDVNKEKKAILKKVWNKTNKEKIAFYGKSYRDINKERIHLVSKVWRQANPERTTAKAHKRRALKLNAEGIYTHSDITILLITQNSKCVYCKTDLIITGKGKYHVDHIMPLFLGGTNYPENLQLLCPTCNCSKGPKHPDIYEKQINHNQNKGN